MSVERTLLTQAVSLHNLAAISSEASYEDEFYLNVAGFQLAQSLEMAIKFQLEQNGINYPFTHNIEVLVQEAKANGLDVALTEYLDARMSTFTLWETQTRYVLNYQLEKATIDRALEEIGHYLEKVKNRYQSGPDSEKKN